jgi:glycosyltransferase involved in cell wall biosynthesis
MRIAFVTSALDPSVGGPFASIGGLARSLAVMPNTRVAVFGIAGPHTPWQEHATNWEGCDFRVYQGGIANRVTAAVHALTGAGGTAYDILHFGELWTSVALIERAIGGRRDGVIVHSPRGMLEPWSLKHHAIRKQVAWLAGQQRAIARVDLLHATSSEECESVRRLGFRQPVAVIPNAVTIEPLPSLRRPSHGIRTALALGRLHPKKGLELLIRAWARVAHPAWRLLIAGPDEGGYAARLRQLVTELQTGTVDIAGPQYGAARRAMLDHAHLFTCSSYSENFGIVVAEAMERGLAVITTTGTPWKIVHDLDLGWHVHPCVDELAGALADALASPQEELDIRGARGRRFVEEHLAWPAAAQQMRQAYEWMLHGGAPPSCVSLA